MEEETKRLFMGIRNGLIIEVLLALAILSLIFLFGAFFVDARSDVLVWRDNYAISGSLQQGSSTFNFTIYDAPSGGSVYYSNQTTLTTDVFGRWEFEAHGVGALLTDTGKDYFLEVIINGIAQSPRKRLTLFNFLRVDANDTIQKNLTVNGTLNTKGLIKGNNITVQMINITPLGDTGGSVLQSGALNIDNTNNPSRGFNLYSNASSVDRSVASIYVINPLYDAPILYIFSNTTSSQGLIRLDGPTPEIEYVETDQAAPAGKFETRVQNNRFQINSRNALDNSFENIFSLRQGQEWSSGESFLAMTGNVSSTSSNFLEFINERNSATTSLGILWTNTNSANNLFRIHAKGGTSFNDPVASFDILDLPILLLNETTVVSNKTLNLENNNITGAEWGFFNRGLQVNNTDVCLEDGTNCASTTIVWTNSSTETSIKTGYPNNVTIRGKINLTDTTINADDAAFSIIVGSSATNFVDFWVAGTQTLKFGRELNIAGFFTPNPGDRVAFGTAGLVNVLDINGNTRIVQLQAQNRLRLDTVNGSGNVTVNAKRFILPVNNRTDLSLCFGGAACNDGIYSTAESLRFVINDLDIMNLTTKELDLDGRNATFDKWKDEGGCLDMNHTHNGTGCGGKSIPHDLIAPIRALNTEYQNTGNRPIIVTGNIVSVVSLANDKAYMTPYTGVSSPATTRRPPVGFYSSPAGASNITFSFSFTVPAGNFYTLNATTAGSGSVNLDLVEETDL